MKRDKPKSVSVVTLPSSSKSDFQSSSFYARNDKAALSSSTVRILAGLLLACLVFNIFLSMNHGEDVSFSFERLLQIAQDVNNNKVNSFFQDLRISPLTEDWGFFNFFRDFVNRSISAINSLLFIVGGIANIITFVTYFLQYFAF